MCQDNNDHLCQKRHTWRKEIDRPSRIGKLVQRMSNKTDFVNYGDVNPDVILYRKPGKFFPEKFPRVRKVPGQYVSYIVILWSTLFRGKQPGSQKNRIPAALKRDWNTKPSGLRPTESRRGYPLASYTPWNSRGHYFYYYYFIIILLLLFYYCYYIISFLNNNNISIIILIIFIKQKNSTTIYIYIYI